MLKRGQVSTFVVVGIVVLLAILLVFYFRSELLGGLDTSTDVQKELDVEMMAFDDYVKDCLMQSGDNSVQLLGNNGGVFEPVSVVEYHGINYRSLCEPFEEGCAASVVVKSYVEDLLDERIENELKACLFSENFNEDLVISFESLDVTSKIGQEIVEFEVFLPSILEKKGISKEREVFFGSVESPLGSLIDVANDILSVESQGDTFDPLSYSLSNYGKYLVDIDKPYPHKIFEIGVLGDDYRFKFAVRGVELEN